MIHVDVRHDRQHRRHVVETSVDGGPWTTQFVHDATAGDSSMDDETRQREAEQTARVFVAGLRFAGAEVRATSGGYGL